MCLSPVWWCSLRAQVTKQGRSVSEPLWECRVSQFSQDDRTCRLFFCVCCVYFQIFAIPFLSPQRRGSCVVWYCLEPVIRATLSLQAKDSIQASLSPLYWWILVPIDDFTEPCSCMGGAHYNSLDTKKQRSGVRPHFPPGAACMGSLVG